MEAQPSFRGVASECERCGLDSLFHQSLWRRIRAWLADAAVVAREGVPNVDLHPAKAVAVGRCALGGVNVGLRTHSLSAGRSGHGDALDLRGIAGEGS